MKKIENVTEKKRIVYLDFIRIIACFLVIFNHQEGYVLYKYDIPIGIIGRCFYIASSIFTTVNTPLFFMITGTLLLGRGKEETEKKYLKRIWRAVLFIITANTLFYCFKHYSDFFLDDLIYGIFSCSISGIYWYFYAYLGFVILLRFFRKIAASMDGYDFIYLVGAHCIINLLYPLLNYLSGNSITASNPFKESLSLAVVDCMFYGLAGYFIDKKRD